MDAVPRLLIGSLKSEHVLVAPTRWEFPESEDYWDGNWFYADVTIRAGAFRGSYEALLRSDEFVGFRDALQVLYEKLTGTATFETLEHWLVIYVEGDGRGHFTARCEARDEIGNKLTFDLAFDQTELPALIRDLEELTKQFPVRGTR